MSVRVIDQAFATDIPTGPRFVLVTIASHLNHKQESLGANPSITRIMHLTGISKRSVIRYIEYLESHGYIKVKRGRDKHGHRSLNHYFLTLGATVAHGSTNDGVTVAPRQGAKYDTSHVPNEQVDGVTVALKQVENNKTEEQEEKVNQKEFPIWFRTLLGIDTIESESPVVPKDFKKMNAWAEEKTIPEECLERASNYIDSDWRGALKKRIKVAATFYNAALKEYEWSKNRNGFNSKRVSQTDPEEIVPGVTPSGFVEPRRR